MGSSNLFPPIRGTDCPNASIESVLYGLWQSAQWAAPNTMFFPLRITAESADAVIVGRTIVLDILSHGNCYSYCADDKKQYNSCPL